VLGPPQPGGGLRSRRRRHGASWRGAPPPPPSGPARRLRATVLRLDGFVRRLQGRAAGGGAPEPLLQAGDPACYRGLVERCLVARPAGCKALPPRVVFQQISSQSDVVARVIQRICEKKKKNVLAFGYALMNDNIHQQPCMPNVYNYMPNNTTETIRQSVLWEIILSRVGDDVMMYLLEHCALFVLVPPSCCYQICGQPFYELPLQNTAPLPEFFRLKCPGQKRSILSGYLQGGFFGRRHLKRAKSRRQSRSKVRDVSGFGSRRSLMVWGDAGQTPKTNKPIPNASDQLEGQQRASLCLSLTTPLRKRKWGGQCEISSKRMKIMQAEKERENGMSNPVPVGSKTQLMLAVDGVGVNTSEGNARSLPEEGFTLVKPVPPRGECGAQNSVVSGTAQENQMFPASSKGLEQEQENRTRYAGPHTRTRPNSRLAKVKPGNSGARSAQQLAKETTAVGRDIPETRSPKSSRASSLPAMQIERCSLLYSCQHLKECLPKSFILNRLKGSLSGGRRLVETIFFSGKFSEPLGRSKLPSCQERRKRLPKRYWQMRNVFQELLQNHARCPYLAVLRKNCPIQVAETGKGPQKGHQEESLFTTLQVDIAENGPRSVPADLNTFPGVPGGSSGKGEPSRKESELHVPQGASSSDLTAFLKQHSSHWQVYTFVRECLERVIPAALWGCDHNKCRFYRNMKKFISLGKFGSFSLQELMWKMKVNSCAWLRLKRGHFVPASEHSFRRGLLSKFLYWLMESYIAELLRSFFYITETMFQKNLLFFFRKSIWSKLQIGFVVIRLRVLLKEEIKTLQQKKCVPLASKLRFIPKPNGLRPVVKLHSVVGAETFCKTSRDKKVQYFNTRLKNLFSVLNYERLKNPALLGSSVFGKDDIYVRWKKFVLKVLASNPEMPRFYFVKADVTGAYDTIPHDKLVEVILQAIAPGKKTTYSIRRYAVIVRTRNGFMRRYYRRYVRQLFLEFIPDMKRFVCHLQESSSLQNAIVVEQERRSSLFEFFLQFIRNNILKIEDRYYVQCCGIPQGSILSTLLCNLCYGDMEDKLLRGVQEDGLLMRLTDDFLLVTPHLTQAKAFLRTLAVGIPEYGFAINPAKTVVNFPVDEDIPGCSEFKQLPAHCVIPWCGLLISTQTLEMYCDYSRYACTSIRSSLSFNCSNKPGVSMRNKLLAVLQLKCHSLFVDLQINSLRTVCINVYKILLLQAFRFHACVLQLPFRQQVKNNPHFFLRVISDSTSCCFSALKAKNAGGSGRSTQWLSYHAFIVKLANHKVIYKCLLGPLKQCKIKLLRQIPEGTMKLLKEVTEPALYEDFKVILD
uniref:Telomerase reverse transcriptase n=1 Tax=Varanus komodoensis TaxID=61221 RepID=A0A8D2J9J2_VARKO